MNILSMLMAKKFGGKGGSGGASSPSYDLIISYKRDNTNNEICELVVGNFETVKTKIFNGQEATALIRFDTDDTNGDEVNIFKGNYSVAVTYWHDYNGEYLCCYNGSYSDTQFIVNPDDTISF